MKEPAKADLAAAVTRLTEENAALRDLLGAVQAMADAPKPAAYSDRYYWACTDRLSTIAVWAKLDEGATGEYSDLVIRGWAKALRAQAAEPVGYEVRAEPEPEAANPPHHMTGSMIGPCCLAEDGGYTCNAQEGHDGPQHVAYGSDGRECHRWPVTSVTGQDAGGEAPATVTG